MEEIMASRSLRCALLGAALSSVVVLAGGIPRAFGQYGWQPSAGAWRPAPGPACLPSSAPGNCPPSFPAPPAVAPAAPAPGQPAAPTTRPPATTTQPPTTTQPSTTQPQPTPVQPSTEQNQAQEPSLGQEQAAATGTETAGLAAGADPGGYLDPAIPRTMFRLRYDAGFNMNHPDRATFFYGTWQELSFHPHGILRQDGAFGGVLFDPRARGPVALPGKIDYQEVSPYLEVAANDRLSAFVELPNRFIDFDNLQEDNDREPGPTGKGFPEPGFGGVGGGNDNNPHTNFDGLSDVRFGFKAALLADPCQYLTFQFRTYAPTGDVGHGLGTGHWSLEPGLLLYKRLTDRLVLQGEFEAWFPIQGGPLAGNVLTYGVGLGYDIYQCGNLRVTPIAEFVGWTVLNGFESFIGDVGTIPVPAGVNVPTGHGVLDAGGNTIVNAKLGVRTYFGCHSDLYAGFGQALTTIRWYDEIVRVEYRLSF
jgi:hypothetical protein